jgi:hypothetical protein
MRYGERIEYVGPGFIDGKSCVGTGYPYENIDDYITAYSDANGLENGMLVYDTNYGVTWQIYSTTGAGVSVSVSTDWTAQLYDGRFHVACLFIGTAPKSETSFNGLRTEDGYSVQENDVVLVVGDYPNLNGIWVAHETLDWERHSIFDESIDNIRAVTFVVDNGDNYKNSQWRFSTIGDITPETLNSSYQTFINNVELFMSYTWLNFEMIGGNYPVKEVTSGSTAISTHDVMVSADATDGQVGVARQVWQHQPNVEYRLIKTDNSTNKVVYGISSDPYDKHVLLEQSDWVSIINPENNASDSSGFIVLSNRINKIIIPSAITVAGQLDIDIPSGYRLWQLRVYVSTPGGGSGDSYLNIGTSSGAFDLASSEGIDVDGVVSVVDIDDNTVTEVWVSEVGGGFGFDSNEITVEYHVIKEN